MNYKTVAGHPKAVTLGPSAEPTKLATFKCPLWDNPPRFYSFVFHIK